MRPEVPGRWELHCDVPFHRNGGIMELHPASYLGESEEIRGEFREIRGETRENRGEAGENQGFSADFPGFSQIARRMQLHTV